MQLPDSFVNEMNDFFTRHNEVPRDGFYESFDKVPLKGVRFSRSKISGSAQETEFLGDMDEEIKQLPRCGSASMTQAPHSDVGTGQVSAGSP